ENLAELLVGEIVRNLDVRQHTVDVHLSCEDEQVVVHREPAHAVLRAQVEGGRRSHRDDRNAARSAAPRDLERRWPRSFVPPRGQCNILWQLGTKLLFEPGADGRSVELVMVAKQERAASDLVGRDERERAARELALSAALLRELESGWQSAALLER